MTIPAAAHRKTPPVTCGNDDDDDDDARDDDDPHHRQENPVPAPEQRLPTVVPSHTGLHLTPVQLPTGQWVYVHPDQIPQAAAPAPAPAPAPQVLVVPERPGLSPWAKDLLVAVLALNGAAVPILGAVAIVMALAPALIASVTQGLIYAAVAAAIVALAAVPGLRVWARARDVGKGKR